MHISVWSHDSNPSIDRRTFRRSRHYCETEVREGRAVQVDTDDIRRGIHLLVPVVAGSHKPEQRGSSEQDGCLTARESKLNSEYRTRGDKFDIAIAEGRAVPLPVVQVPILAVEYEDRLDRHILDSRKGMPRMCNVIAARVKTLLSTPALACG